MDWASSLARLDADCSALFSPVLTCGKRAALIALYSGDSRFRKRIGVERYRHGAGDCADFTHRLRDTVTVLREGLYE